ncbi:MAG TPA: hypothetical protein VNT26_09380 [Candidatus Sulfotelmatobacter sp.]|nr:hypothetical protein [Candidatus Sulfotelmatobacter sp.]
MKQNDIPFLAMADTAMKNYEQALRSGLKFQEEAVQWWSGSFNQTAAAQDWQKRFVQLTALANKAVPVAQKNMEEMMGFMQKSGRTSAELLKKAAAAVQTPVMAESQAKWMDFWSSSLGAARSNAETLSQIHAQAITSWVDLVQKSAAAAEMRAPAAA